MVQKKAGFADKLKSAKPHADRKYLMLIYYKDIAR